MKPVRWTEHALTELDKREMSREEAAPTLAIPNRIGPGNAPHLIYQRRYHDSLLNEEMLLRLLVEESEVELVVMTLYKPSRLRKYD